MDAELEQQLRAAINPAYADMRGTESYERKRLLGEIDRLRAAIATTTADTIGRCVEACDAVHVRPIVGASEDYMAGKDMAISQCVRNIMQYQAEVAP